MLKTIISDTSCLILLAKIGELDLLNKIYGEIIITPEISLEYGQSLPSWIIIVPVKNRIKQIEFEKIVDLGEASALALALEFSNVLVVLDDKRGRIQTYS